MQRARPFTATPRLFASRRLLTPSVLLLPALALLLLYALAYVQFAVQLAAFPFDLDQGEGYDAWSAWLINLGQVPYTSNAAFPYYSSNYPPLWSYLVSIPAAWLGPGLLPARVVSTIAALLTAALLGLAARRLSGRWIAAVFAAGFFIASPYVFHTTPLARVNSLALLAAVVALSLFETPTRTRVVLGSIALLAALFTKPTTLDAVAAGVGAVVMTRPRLGIVSAGIVAVGGAIGLSVLLLLSHGAFWLNVVAGNANPFDTAQLQGYLSNFTMLHCVLLVTAVAEAVALVRRGCWSPWVLYLVTASVAALGVAKWGAGESYFLGAIAAACVLSASWIARFLASATSLPMRAALGAALLIQALLLSHATLSAAVPWLPDRGPQGQFLGHAPTDADRVAGEELADQIRNARGPALSEDPSFAVVAGDTVVGNATHLRNLYLLGLWDPAPLVDEITQRRYGIVILNAELYPEPVLKAVGQRYFQTRVVHMNGATYHVFVPGTQ
jgi:hypothetical protein